MKFWRKKNGRFGTICPSVVQVNWGLGNQPSSIRKSNLQAAGKTSTPCNSTTFTNQWLLFKQWLDIDNLKSYIPNPIYMFSLRITQQRCQFCWYLGPSSSGSAMTPKGSWPWWADFSPWDQSNDHFVAGVYPPKVLWQNHVILYIYPLVNVYIANWKITIFNR